MDESRLDLLYSVIGENFNSGTSKLCLSILGELFVEGSKDSGSDVEDRNFDVGAEPWVDSAEIFGDEIVKLGTEFDTGWTTTDNGKVEKLPFPFFGGCG